MSRPTGGVATPIYCLADGRPGLILEAYAPYRGLPAIERWVACTGKRTLYVVTKRPFSTITPATTEQILRDVRTSPRWAMVPVESEVANLTSVQVWKLVPRNAEQ